MGRIEQTQELLHIMSEEREHRLARGIDLPSHYYELALMRAMHGRFTEAFETLERVIGKGWQRWYFDRDPILEAIRALLEIASLKAQYDTGIDRMRDIVAATQ